MTRTATRTADPPTRFARWRARDVGGFFSTSVIVAVVVHRVQRRKRTPPNRGDSDPVRWDQWSWTWTEHEWTWEWTEYNEVTEEWEGEWVGAWTAGEYQLAASLVVQGGAKLDVHSLLMGTTSGSAGTLTVQGAGTESYVQTARLGTLGDSGAFSLHVLDDGQASFT